MDPSKKLHASVATRSDRPNAAPLAEHPAPEPTVPTRLHPDATPPPEAADESPVGRTFGGQFRIERRLGSGGMGTIYLARQLDVDRLVALKVAHPELTSQPKKVERFRREGVAIGQLQHPHVVQLHLTGQTEDGLLYLVMEYVRGRTLADELRACDRLPQRRAVRIALQIADTLTHAHTLGIVHRDLKPANIMLVEQRDEPDFVKVLDFGIAKLLDTPEEARLTRTGARLGTPPYMAPEQVRGEPVDGRADIYSLGLILYEMIAGERPYYAETPLQYYAQHLQGEPPTLPSQRHPDLVVAESLERVLTACLQKDRDQRYPNADMLHRDLGAVLRELETEERRPPAPVRAASSGGAGWPWVVLAAVAVMAAGATWLAMGTGDEPAVRVATEAAAEPPASVPPAAQTPSAIATPTPLPTPLDAPSSPDPPVVSVMRRREADPIGRAVVGVLVEPVAPAATPPPAPLTDAWLPRGAVEVYRTLSSVLYRSPLSFSETVAAYRAAYADRPDYLVVETTYGESSMLTVVPAAGITPFRSLTVTPAEMNPMFGAAGAPLIGVNR